MVRSIHSAPASTAAGRVDLHGWPEERVIADRDLTHVQTTQLKTQVARTRRLSLHRRARGSFHDVPDPSADTTGTAGVLAPRPERRRQHGWRGRPSTGCPLAARSI